MDFHIRGVDAGWVSRALVNHTGIGDVWRLGPPLGRLAKERPNDLSLVAACDLNLARAEEFCRDSGFAKAYTDSGRLDLLSARTAMISTPVMTFRRPGST